MTASTIHDVAELAGTSIATVSRALNEPAKVRPSTRERILAAVETLSFRPNLLGRQLRSERTHLIGVVLPDVFNPVFGECMQGIEESAAASGYRVLLMTTRYDASREAYAIDTLLSQRVDGLILTVAEAASHPVLSRLGCSGVPYQLVYNHSAAHPCVSVDNRQAARDGVRLLVAQGHRRVLMLTGNRAASDRAAQRYLGYCDALKEAGLVPETPLEVDFNDRTLPRPILDRLVDPLSRPTALFCGNDLLALVVMRELRAVGMRVPDEISIVGFDGLAIGELLTPPLATVCQPNRDIGSAAWHHLQGVLDGGPTSSSILPHRIRADGTVAPFPLHPPTEHLS
jgi:DNA-binding LacI/PurR family transcriptional regulator